MDKITNPPQLSPDNQAALAEGRCSQPFSILGPRPHGEGQWLTVFHPDLASLAAVGAGGTVPLARVAGDLFAGPIPAGPYRLKARSGGGVEWTFEDPYRFGPVLGEMDLHLLAEGTHKRLWRTVAATPCAAWARGSGRSFCPT